MKCPCGGKIEKVKKEFIYRMVNCGILELGICSRCKSEYFSNIVVKRVKNILKREKPVRYVTNYIEK